MLRSDSRHLALLRSATKPPRHSLSGCKAITLWFSWQNLQFVLDVIGNLGSDDGNANETVTLKHKFTLFKPFCNQYSNMLNLFMYKVDELSMN